MEVSSVGMESGQSSPAVASLATALRVGEEVFREALQKAPTLPKLADVGRAPATLADAIVARDAKEEERRRREAVRKDVKLKGKQVSPLPAVVEHAAPAPTPGLHIGSVNEASAFWMFVEDYFRDITQEDIMSLMPVALNPEDDDCLTVPFLGRDPRGVDRLAPAKGKQATVREEDDAVERRGRGRGAGKLELRPSDVSGLSVNGTGPSFLPQSPFPGQHPDALVQGWRPDGRPAATMLDACTDEEARAFCQLAHKLGLLDDLDMPGFAPPDRLSGVGPAFSTMDRAQLDRVLMNLRKLGEMDPPEAAAATSLAAATTPFPISGDAGASAAAGQPVAATAGKPTAGDDDDTQSSNRGAGMSQEQLPRAAGGDYMHPYLRRILERPCTAYVLNPCGGTGSLVESAQDDDDGISGAAAGGVTSKGARGNQAGGGATGTYNAKTPAPGRVSYRGVGSVTHEAAISPHGQQHHLGAEPGSAAGTGPHSGADMQLDTPQLPTLQPLQPLHHAQDDAAGGLGGVLQQSGSTPTPGGPGSATGGGGRGGRARNSVNYSALAGKKDKERAKELREREKEERERAKSGIAKVTRKPGLRGGASWSAGSGSAAAALAGLQKPLTNNPLALLNKVPLLFKDEPGTNTTTAAVHSLVVEGGPEGTLEQQWTQLDAAADVLSMAPDDEVLAELVALQSELVQQVAINRSRVAALMEAVVGDLPNQRATNQQCAEMEEQIKTYMQRKAEVKRNLKREKREMEKRQALAALKEPASPRAVTGRPKKFASMPSGGFDNLGALGTGEGVEAGEAWRGSTPGASGGEGLPAEAGPAAEAVGLEEFELVDPLAHRTHDEEALCAICGDGLSVDPNMIVFCERCDIAVHQHCYGVRSIPAEEWLCWPCRMYEESQRAAGVPQSEIRPKRWEMEARGITHAELPGGSLAVSCCLCPVRQGAFKRTVDGKAWAHVVCALWHEGPTVLNSDSPDTIDSLGLIRPERWRAPCTICGKVAGAVAKCNFGHCQCYFHPLCARRAGNYLVARLQPGSKQLRYRAYCHNHSEAQRNKDLHSGAAARPLEVFTAATTSAGPGRPPKRGSSVGGPPGASGALEAVEGVAFGTVATTAPPAPALQLAGCIAVEVPAGEPDAAAGTITLPVKKKFGRPPKLLKQQQIMMQQMQLFQMQQQQQQPLLSPQAGGPSTPADLPTPGMQHLPTPTGHALLLQQQQQLQQPVGPALPGAAQADAIPPPAAAAAIPAVPPSAIDNSAAAAAAAAAAAVGRPPLPGSRLSLSAMAKRKAAAGVGAGMAVGAAPGALVLDGSSAGTGAPIPNGVADTTTGMDTTAFAAVPFGAEMKGPGPRRRGPGRASSSTSLQVAGGAGAAVASMTSVDARGASGAVGSSGRAAAGAADQTVVEADALDAGIVAGGMAAVATVAMRAAGGANATSSKTSSGPGAGGGLSASKAVDGGVGAGAVKRIRQTSSSTGVAGGGAPAGGGATASSDAKQQLVKTEPEEQAGEGESAIGPSVSAAAAVMAMARARTAAAAAAAGPSGSVTMERLADLEHQRSMLGRWGPNSVRQELELLRTMADTVRRRERCKRAQYRLLRDAISAQSSQPAAVLSFLESWEWPDGGHDDASPFSNEDFSEPPAVTALDRFLEANKAAATAAEAAEAPSRGVAGGASGSAAGGAAGGSGMGVKRQRVDGAGVDVLGGSLSGGEEQLPAAKKFKLRSSTHGAGPETLKEIMSGRDWRRRVVMGPDGKWVPRPTPGSKAAKAAAARASGFLGGGGGAGLIGDGAATEAGCGGGGYSSSKASRDDVTTVTAAATEQEVDAEEVFEDAQEGFAEGAVPERDLDMEIEEGGAVTRARQAGRRGASGGGLATDSDSSVSGSDRGGGMAGAGDGLGGGADSVGEATGVTRSDADGNEDPGAGHIDGGESRGLYGEDGGGGSGVASPQDPLGTADVRPDAGDMAVGGNAKGGPSEEGLRAGGTRPSQQQPQQRLQRRQQQQQQRGPAGTSHPPPLVIKRKAAAAAAAAVAAVAAAEDLTDVSSDDPPIASLRLAGDRPGGISPQT